MVLLPSKVKLLCSSNMVAPGETSAGTVQLNLITTLRIQKPEGSGGVGREQQNSRQE